jgi:sugar lactone lactonase YvrE
MNCGACGHKCLGASCQNGTCTPETIVTGQASPMAIAVDAATIYWLNRGTSAATYHDGTVVAKQKAGGAATVLATGQTSPAAIALDASRIYWVNSDPQNGTVNAIAKGGGAVAVLLSGEPGPNAIAVDATGVYWNRNWSSTADLMRVNLAGGTAVSIAQRSNVVINGVAADGTNAFFTTVASGGGQGGLWKVDVMGGFVFTLESNVDCFGVVSFGPDLYYGRMFDVWRRAKDDSTTATLGTASSNPTRIAVDQNYVYWLDGNALMAAPTVGGSMLTLAQGLTKPSALAVDATYVYWTDSQAGTIQRTPKP